MVLNDNLKKAFLLSSEFCCELTVFAERVLTSFWCDNSAYHGFTMSAHILTNLTFPGISQIYLQPLLKLSDF